MKMLFTPLSVSGIILLTAMAGRAGTIPASIFDRQLSLPLGIRTALEKEATHASLSWEEGMLIKAYHRDETAYRRLVRLVRPLCVEKKDSRAEDPIAPLCTDVPEADDYAKYRDKDGVYYRTTAAKRKKYEKEASDLEFKWMNDGKECTIPQKEADGKDYTDHCGNIHHVPVP